MRFRDEDEAIDLVNQSRYGLANSVWCGIWTELNAWRKAWQPATAGSTRITFSYTEFHNGGVNLSGLGGGVLGPNTFFDYLRDLSVVRPL